MQSVDITDLEMKLSLQSQKAHENIDSMKKSEFSTLQNVFLPSKIVQPEKNRVLELNTQNLGLFCD